MSPCGIGTYRDEIVQIPLFQNDEGRHDFRKAGWGHSLSGIVFIQHTPTVEFLEKNAMGWSHTPRGKLVRSDRRLDLYRMSSYALRSGNGWSDGLGTDQQQTDKHPGRTDEK
jgi:hypothetical protein